MRVSLKAGGLVALACVWLGLVGCDGFREVPRAELEARYAVPTSKFTEVDGTRIHYTDAGAGPVVVLLPPSFMNLRVWDATAEILAREFRVIRIDFPVIGLSGPDPSQDFTMDRFADLLHGLTTTLGVEKFSLVGTSSGGIVAFQYAGRWPERVERLVLINCAGLPRTAATNPNRPRGGALSRWWRSHYSSRKARQDSMNSQMGTGRPAPAELVTIVHDLNRREGIKEDSAVMLKQFRTGDPQAALAEVRAPTMIIWGKKNITLSHLEANVFELWLSGAPSMVLKYDELGHYPYVEDPQRVAADLSAFFKGERDDELARTIRQPVAESNVVR
ncbi:MAG TPA: alpha/beta hydrolase [Steroidobacteraceae bacterium]|nr:alpha/beta hydrolase [Steroidobacteraceae bacterium]HNS26575.1 alpha/beta hydrolase [Steroidobacteraceae bacterium]